MRKYTKEEIIELKLNRYTYNVTKHKLYFTIEFKEKFVELSKLGKKPRAILTELGYNPKMFSQDAISAIAKRIRKQGKSNQPFREGEYYSNENLRKRQLSKPANIEEREDKIVYLSEMVELLKNKLLEENKKKRQ